MLRIKGPGKLPRDLQLKDPGWWRGMMMTDLFFLCSVVLAHGKKREYRDLNWVHESLCEFLDPKKNPIPQLLVLIFRDGLKSSIARGLVIQWFLTKLYEKTEDKAFYFSGVFALAKDQLERIIKEILENELIQAFFDGMIPRQKADFEYCALDEGKVRYRRVELDIGSPEKPLTGHHFGLGVNDNLMNVVNTRTAAMRRKIVKDWQQQESILSENAREVVFETPWYPDDVSGTILNPDGLFDFNKLYRQPCKRFISDTGYAVFSCPAVIGSGRIGTPVFPAKVDTKYLERKRAKQGKSLYGSMYELQPVSEGDIVFSTSWINHYLEAPRNFVRNLSCDAAGTKGKESSYSAMSLGDWDQEGRLHLPYAEKRKVSPMELYEWVLKLIDLSEKEGRPVFRFGVEKEKYGIFLKDLIDVKHKNMRTIISLLEIKGRPRGTRLMSLQVPYEGGMILSKPGLKDYEDEVRTYFLDKDSGVDILETVFYHFEMKILPKKIDIPLSEEDANIQDFLRIISRGKENQRAFGRSIARTF